MQYYNKNAKEFVERTKDLDVSILYKPFEEKLSGNKILDIGFGSGRDSLYFSKKYDVVSIDNSIELVSLMHGQLEDVRLMDVRDIDFQNEFDGIWACASLLHLNKSDIEDVLQKLYNALTKKGVLFMSFKYGTFTGMRDDRYFTDFTEESFLEVLNDAFDSIEMFQTKDVRVGKSGAWLNVLLTK